MPKGFFVVDLHQFELISARGGRVEEMAAYLSLLKSTGKSNTKSAGGIRSVQTMTGMTRAQSKQAVDNLICMGLVEALTPEKVRSKSEPRYRLPIHETRKRLGKKEKGVFDAVLKGVQPATHSEDQAARRAFGKGWLERRNGSWVAIEFANLVAFIPNHFAQVSKGASPLARLVRVGEEKPLELAVRLYSVQNLMDHGGVSPEIIRRYFHLQSQERCGNSIIHYLKADRHWVDPMTAYVTDVWGFADANLFPDLDELRSAIEVLERTHVIEWSVFSVNGKPEGKHGFKRPDRPLGTLRMGRQLFLGPERAPALMAYLLYRLRRDGGKVDQTVERFIENWQQSGSIVAVEDRAVQHVEAIGVLRLAHRAETKSTNSWFRDHATKCEQEFFYLKELILEEFDQVHGFVDELSKFVTRNGAISIFLNESSTEYQ